jgi:hypothetical protein
MREEGASGKLTGRPIAHHQQAAANASTNNAAHATPSRWKTGAGFDGMPGPQMLKYQPAKLNRARRALTASEQAGRCHPLHCAQIA